MRKDSKTERTSASDCDVRTPDQTLGDVTPTTDGLAGQASSALPPIKTLASTNLMEDVLERNNLNLAYRKVKANQGAPGVDGMTVEQALGWLKDHKGELLAKLATGE